MPLTCVACPACAHVGPVSHTRLPGVLVCSACDSRTYHHGRRASYDEDDAAWARYEAPRQQQATQQPQRPRKRKLKPRVPEAV